MKLPIDIHNVTLVNNSGNNYLIPPLGFMEIEEGNGGYGDCYGLYWQLGKEDKEPIVCEFQHEEDLLDPVFPNLSAFISWYNDTDGQEGPPINLNDKNYFLSLYMKAKVSAKNGRSEEAIERLEASVSLFSEYSDSWSLLAEQYYKLGNIIKAEECVVNSILSNWMFGIPSKKLVELFHQLKAVGQLAGSPLVNLSKDLVKYGDYSRPIIINYAKLKEAISLFETTGDNRASLLLSQNYAYLLSSEKKEIKEANSFDLNSWLTEFRAKVQMHFPKRLR
ncbi:tetratricopeptide repeat protein [Desertivirga brevis]|uniref:tetratricopeptide repeat protein n=1 Tax=Desertivirga brevis TaxID=2810310 RepID=UPI001A96B8D9|nr:hypothetical protein [Pedobacter sp. SYSU D00873]